MVFDNRIQDLIGDGGEMVGAVVVWSLKDIRVKRNVLEQTAQKWGIPDKFLPEPPDDTKALRSAVDMASADGFKKSGERADIGSNDDDQMVYSLQRRVLRDTSTGDVEWRQHSKVKLFKHVGQLGFDPSHPFASKINDYWLDMRDSNSPEEVRRMVIRRIKSMDGFPIRPDGGVYMVLAPDIPELLNLRGFAMDISEHNVINCLSIHKSKMEVFNDSARNLAEDSLAKELSEMFQEIKKFEQNVPRASTLEARIAEFQELRARADKFRLILGIQVDDLNSAVEKLEERARALIDETA